MGDDLLNLYSDHPTYENNFVQYIREYCKKGDKVIVIGGYYGVSTVAAANQVGKTGQVILFEATEDWANRVDQITKLNNVSDQVKINQSIVGPVYNPKGGDISRTGKTPISDLPSCDILAIDCDGCELEVLKNISIEPEMIIVEHHGQCPTEEGLEYEYQEDNLIKILHSKNYEIVDEFTENRIKGGFEDTVGYFVAQKR